MPPNLTGHFLLAAKALPDPNFARTVVLLVKHDEDGALGLVVNRPLDVTVADAVGEAVPAAEDVADRLYKGGPCPGPLMVLHERAPFAGDKVVTGCRFTTDRAEIEAIMRGGDGDGPARYFIGYSGWAALQLEGELAEGSWHVVAAQGDDVFAPPEQLWDRLVRRAQLGRFVDPRFIPDDPSAN